LQSLPSVMKKHLLFASLLVLSIACGNNETATDTAATTAGDTAATETATHPASPGGEALVPDVVAGTTVLVMLSDGSIAVREQAIPPGPAILTVENRGTGIHNLFVEGEGISRAAGDNIAAGGTATVDVQFKAGSYTLYCPILDHRDKGEQVSITVGGSGTPPAASETTGTTATTTT
jgi:uncharacterized cupredoxin-like copper-binding protein